MLFKAGVQTPEIPLFEVVGKGLNVSPAQIGATCVNEGVADGLTTMVILTAGEQDPPGVKV